MKKQYHAPMHSAEHILNQTMVRIFGCERSFSNHIERKKSKCDYHFDRPLSDLEEQEIERKVNEVISQNLEIQTAMLPREEAIHRYNLTRLPEEAGDEIRIVTIGDYDACPCIGEHVENTSEIGLFRMVSSSFEEGVLRIRYKLQQE